MSRSVKHEMWPMRLTLTTGLAGALLGGGPGLVRAQANDPAAQAAMIQQFNQFDVSKNGYLSGTELDRCGCRGFDGDGDGRVTALEYLSARGAIPGAPRRSPASAAKPRPATKPPVAAPVPASLPVAAALGGLAPGTRVKAGCYGNMYEGVIERSEGARVWVKFDDQKDCDGWRDANVVKPHGTPGTRGAAYPVGAAVEVKSVGRWHPAVILAVQNARYRVHYENYTNEADEWVDASRVRQTPDRARQKTGAGGAVPAGKYECYNFSGGSLRYQTEFTVTGAGMYVGVDRKPGTFAKDAAGIVRFKGGAFGGTQGDFQYNNGRAMIYMHTPSKPGKRAGMDCEGPRR